MFLPFLAFHPPVIAHRGARMSAPENTLSAFRIAYDQGARWIEVDAKISQDGVPLIMHDDRLERTTNGQGLVADMDWAELQKLDAGSWFSPGYTGEKIPSLADTVKFVLERGMHINIELKPCPGRTQATTMVTIIEVAKIWPDNHTPPLLSSFDGDALAIAAQMHPDWPRGLLLDQWRGDWRDEADRTHAHSLHMNADILTRERVGLLMRSNLPVLAYTVNDPVRARELLDWGVAAVFSDIPKEIIRAL